MLGAFVSVFLTMTIYISPQQLGPNAIQVGDTLPKFTAVDEFGKAFDSESLQELELVDILESDCVVCQIDILESEGYFNHLLKESKIDAEDCPKLPRYTGQKELSGAHGVWLPAGHSDQGNRISLNQRRRNASARYTHLYLKAVHGLRSQSLPQTKKGVPLEYFEWERIIVDEIHVSQIRPLR